VEKTIESTLILVFCQFAFLASDTAV